MLYAIKIKICTGCYGSNRCVDIDSIYLESKGYYKKSALYDHLKENPNTIRVKLGAQPYLLPALSSQGEKYVRSEPNDTLNDNLLKLTRE
jgi:hypothetical protein